MTDMILNPSPPHPNTVLTARAVDLLRLARGGELARQRHRADDDGEGELDVACRDLQRLGLLRANLGLSADGEAVLARRDEPVSVAMTAEAARWVSRHLHNTHHELRGRDADLALAVRDAANLAVIRHERPGVTAEHLDESLRAAEAQASWFHGGVL